MLFEIQTECFVLLLGIGLFNFKLTSLNQSAVAQTKESSAEKSTKNVVGFSSCVISVISLCSVMQGTQYWQFFWNSLLLLEFLVRNLEYVATPITVHFDTHVFIFKRYNSRRCRITPITFPASHTFHVQPTHTQSTFLKFNYAFFMLIFM